MALSFELPVETFESVAVATINILEYLRLVKCSVRYFQAVSSECFGNTAGRASEATPFQPRSPYAMAKAASYWTSSIYREAYGIHVCSGILSNHESPFRPARFVTRKIVSTAVRIARGSKERLRLGNVDIARDWGWAPEYVEGDVAADAARRRRTIACSPPARPIPCANSPPACSPNWGWNWKNIWISTSRCCVPPKCCATNWIRRGRATNWAGRRTARCATSPDIWSPAI